MEGPRNAVGVNSIDLFKFCLIVYCLESDCFLFFNNVKSLLLTVQEAQCNKKIRIKFYFEVAL